MKFEAYELKHMKFETYELKHMKFEAYEVIKTSAEEPTWPFLWHGLWIWLLEIMSRVKKKSERCSDTTEVSKLHKNWS